MSSIERLVNTMGPIAACAGAYCYNNGVSVTVLRGDRAIGTADNLPDALRLMGFQDDGDGDWVHDSECLWVRYNTRTGYLQRDCKTRKTAWLARGQRRKTQQVSERQSRVLPTDYPITYRYGLYGLAPIGLNDDKTFPTHTRPLRELTDEHKANLLACVAQPRKYTAIAAFYVNNPDCLRSLLEMVAG